MIAHVQVAGRTVRLSRVGEGPPVVCLHGYPDDLSVFARLQEALKGDFEVLAVDWPGLGSSEAVEGVAGPTALAAWLAELLDVLDLDDVVLLGHDMGGQPALLCASPRVRGVVAMNCLAMPDGPTSWELRLLRFGRLYGPVLRHFALPVFLQCMWTFFEGRPDPTLRRALWRSFARQPVREQLVRMCIAYDDELPDLPARYAAGGPVLALWSERDHHFDVAHGSGIARTVPGARLEILPGARHWVVWERSDAVADRVRAFVATLRAPRRSG
ncbi:MAG: alpha/beta hydrolase [Alphaproteobacteria bacterium]|nr:alpha/beta hydrolase [Alphaproteobacteria bacterium]